jgi:hypothetical protein
VLALVLVLALVMSPMLAQVVWVMVLAQAVAPL